MHRHPTPASIKLAILDAIRAYNKENPDYMFPAGAQQVIRDAITKECDEHEAFLREKGKL